MRIVDEVAEKNDKQLSVGPDDAINEKNDYSTVLTLLVPMDTQMHIPGRDEWDVSGLPADRRHYLERAISFEQIIDMLLQGAVVLAGRMERYKDPPKGMPKEIYQETYQAVFQVRTDLMVYDLIYNAPDGLRGRYWQSPDRGYLATRLLIESLKEKLLDFARRSPLKREDGAEAKVEDVIASLNASSAKVWIRERDENRNPVIGEKCPEIVVRRWAASERNATSRRAPIGDQIEIKGALIRPGGIEEIPEGKRDRSREIHRLGFT